MIRIVVDAMGGDHAPACNVEGAVDALQKSEDISVVLAGQAEKIRPLLEGLSYDASRLSVLDCPEVIETGESPVFAIQKKRDSSLVRGLRMIREQEADAFVSCGSTGALLVGGQTIAGRLKGVQRAPLAAVIPTAKGFSLLIDSGANVDVKAKNLQQYAVMGSLYMKHMFGIEDPSVGLVNIGTEEEKGNALTREAYPLLAATEGIRFIGNAEARDIPEGAADVLVCEAFTGNVVLKMYEGVAKTLFSQIKKALKSSALGSIGGLLIKPSLKGLLTTFSADTKGGAPMLGLNGLVVKAHGNSKKDQVSTAILQCLDFGAHDIKDKIRDAIGRLES
ncbi:MAG: phosphate acyltransferase PlsX [Lachnospiraceae bacterium]|nr:phosphate acyltransferase PlsX [Lachnospiraceae bacterium]MBP5254013.1 phosphate acyltransferase PlsX [Lachnospiraceae bacterium]